MFTWKKLLPAVIVPTAVCLTAQTSLGGAAEECRTRPGLSTPRGSHWYYRINRPDQRHCWYLAADGRFVRRHERDAKAARVVPAASTSKSSTPDAVPPQLSAHAAPAQATLSQAALMAPSPAGAAAPQPRVRKTPTAREFDARWPSQSGAGDVADTAIVTVNGADAERQAAATAVETSMRPAVTAAHAEPASEGQQVLQQEALQTASMAGGAALALLFFAGWVVKANGRSRLRLGPELATIDGHAWAPPSATGGPAARLPTPTDPAVDLKTSLAELMRDLRRADALSHAPRSAERPPRRKRAAEAAATNKPPGCKAPAAPDDGRNQAGARAPASRSDRAALRRRAPAAADGGCS